LYGFERIFFPTRNPSSLKYIQYFLVLWMSCEKKSLIQNCEALQSERFFCKTKKESTARLTPAVADRRKTPVLH